MGRLKIDRYFGIDFLGKLSLVGKVFHIHNCSFTLLRIEVFILIKEVELN